MTRRRRSSFELSSSVPQVKPQTQCESLEFSPAEHEILARFRPSSRNPHKSVSDVQFNQVVGRAQPEVNGGLLTFLGEKTGNLRKEVA
jgi:hypothetical protein